MARQLFNFVLNPVHQVVPWGSERKLNWYALTEGRYWLDVGEQELFRYTEEFLRHCKTPSIAPPACYEDYFVARLWDDLHDILPFVIEPVPADIAARRRIVERARARLLSAPERQAPVEVVRQLLPHNVQGQDAMRELCLNATWWWHARRLPVMHLVANPEIHLWREGDVVWVAWDNVGINVEGIIAWTAQQGQADFRFDHFVAEVRSFARRLTEEMDARIESVCSGRMSLDALVPVEELRQAQAEWNRAMDVHRLRPAETNWNEVRHALDTIARNGI